MAQCYVPEDIITDILKRLPVKSLLRFKCVKKSWYSLIHNSQFISIHSNYQKTSSNRNKYLLFYYDSCKTLSIRYDDLKCHEYYSLELPSTLEQPIIHGISNGLVCLSSNIKNQPKNIHIWNPAIRKILTLPPRYNTNHYLCSDMLGIGFLPKFNDYKVVKIVHDNKDHIVEIDVYSLRSNSWETISFDGLGLGHKVWCSTLVFVDEDAFSIGWNNKEEGICIYLDLENDIVRHITLPENCPSFNLSVRAYDESIALFHENRKSRLIIMWVMEEGFSWKKKMTFSTFGVFSCSISGVRNNGIDLVMLFNQLDFAFHNVEKEESKNAVVLSDIWNHFKRQWSQGYIKNVFTVNAFTESLFGFRTFFDYKQSN